ncbi:MAG: type II secretion system protein [Clostridium celatum]|nr:type II secretion system protein [Clostridium celatum]
MKFEMQTIKFKIKNVKFKKKKKGFTLIELVAVLAIIAILSTAFIPKFGKYITEAKKVAVLNEAKNVVAAYESAKVRINTSEDNTNISSLISNGYLEKDSIKKIPTDFSVESCKQLMDTENYTFDIDSTSGHATNIKPTKNSSTDSSID